ncbi:MAG TPA: hypothetical protein VNJ08_04420 [Bacteriovoracaceae bacterium]|nr:hypothetical protein [Bacteriovoracaceae bacterium]
MTKFFILALFLPLYAYAQKVFHLDFEMLEITENEAILNRTSHTPKEVILKFKVPMSEEFCLKSPAKKSPCLKDYTKKIYFTTPLEGPEVHVFKISVKQVDPSDEQIYSKLVSFSAHSCKNEVKKKLIHGFLETGDFEVKENCTESKRASTPYSGQNESERGLNKADSLRAAPDKTEKKGSGVKQQ